MPKLKTHRGAAKRFRRTATGKVVRNHSGARHILTKKKQGRKRRLRKSALADATDVRAVKQMLPYS